VTSEEALVCASEATSILRWFSAASVDLILDRWRWRQDSKWECTSESCWKQQKIKERSWGQLE